VSKLSIEELAEYNNFSEQSPKIKYIFPNIGVVNQSVDKQLTPARENILRICCYIAS